jgi:hypothetical protein
MLSPHGARHRRHARPLAQQQDRFRRHDCPMGSTCPRWRSGHSLAGGVIRLGGAPAPEFGRNRVPLAAGAEAIEDAAHDDTVGYWPSAAPRMARSLEKPAFYTLPQLVWNLGELACILSRDPTCRNSANFRSQVLSARSKHKRLGRAPSALASRSRARARRATCTRRPIAIPVRWQARHVVVRYTLHLGPRPPECIHLARTASTRRSVNRTATPRASSTIWVLPEWPSAPTACWPAAR